MSTGAGNCSGAGAGLCKHWTGSCTGCGARPGILSGPGPPGEAATMADLYGWYYCKIISGQVSFPKELVTLLIPKLLNG